MGKSCPCMTQFFTPLACGLCSVSPAVSPQVSVSRRDTPDSSVTLSCRARGFHPRPIHVSWVRDREDILAETDSSGILPNADSTYYRQSSLEISPQQQDGHRYACRVEHSSLGEPTVVWGKWGSEWQSTAPWELQRWGETGPQEGQYPCPLSV
uniref:Ig-like domain-containing protein n=1 Tax=Chelonoidis abingdonii TaxID=106734 RepID=A0A8C0GLC0_CHEAB